jgi:hypothetical protein
MSKKGLVFITVVSLANLALTIYNMRKANA